MTDIQSKIRWCIMGNALTVALVILPVVLLSDGPYFRFGPSRDFVLISVAIDTWTKYGAVLAFIAVIEIVKVISEEIGGPILGYNIYNPDKKNITEFTKCELQVYGNAMFALSNARNIFTTMITISQFDIAMYTLLIGEAASLFTIRALLNEKTFDAYVELEDITCQE